MINFNSMSFDELETVFVIFMSIPLGTLTALILFVLVILAKGRDYFISHPLVKFATFRKITVMMVVMVGFLAVGQSAGKYLEKLTEANVIAHRIQSDYEMITAQFSNTDAFLEMPFQVSDLYYTDEEDLNSFVWFVNNRLGKNMDSTTWGQVLEISDEVISQFVILKGN